MPPLLLSWPPDGTTLPVTASQAGDALTRAGGCVVGDRLAQFKTGDELTGATGRQRPKHPRHPAKATVTANKCTPPGLRRQGGARAAPGAVAQSGGPAGPGGSGDLSFGWCRSGS